MGPKWRYGELENCRSLIFGYKGADKSHRRTSDGENGLLADVEEEEEEECVIIAYQYWSGEIQKIWLCYSVYKESDDHPKAISKSFSNSGGYINPIWIAD